MVVISFKRKQVFMVGQQPSISGAKLLLINYIEMRAHQNLDDWWANLCFFGHAVWAHASARKKQPLVLV